MSIILNCKKKFGQTIISCPNWTYFVRLFGKRTVIPIIHCCNSYIRNPGCPLSFWVQVSIMGGGNKTRWGKKTEKRRGRGSGVAQPGGKVH
jgi:hypothetical protein